MIVQFEDEMVQLPNYTDKDMNITLMAENTKQVNVTYEIIDWVNERELKVQLKLDDPDLISIDQDSD